VTGSSILSRSNDPAPVETRLELVLAVLAHEMTVAEGARRHGVSAESINRWCNRLVDAGKATMEDGMPGKAGSRGSLAGDGSQRPSCAGEGSHVRQLGRRPSAPLDLVDCLAAARSW
jgi:transposase-like protein